MTSTGSADALTVLSPARAACPPWCAARHGVHLGEENWVHHSEPQPLTPGVAAQLCMSIDPVTGAQDGPYVVIGSTEYTPAEAQTLAASLMTLASVGGPSANPPVI
jgi:hypothetical protein